MCWLVLQHMNHFTVESSNIKWRGSKEGEGEGKKLCFTYHLICEMTFQVLPFQPDLFPNESHCMLTVYSTDEQKEESSLIHFKEKTWNIGQKASLHVSRLCVIQDGLRWFQIGGHSLPLYLFIAAVEEKGDWGFAECVRLPSTENCQPNTFPFVLDSQVWGKVLLRRVAR